MFLETLEKLISERGLNNNTFSKQSGIPYKTIDNFWKKGCDNIKLSTLKKIANFFDVTLDYLIFGDNYSVEITDTFSYDEKQLIKKFRQLNKKGKEKTHEQVDILLGNPYFTETTSNSYQTPPLEIAAFGADGTEGEYTLPPEDIT